MIGAGIAALLVGAGWYLFSTHGYLFDVSYPLISSFALLMVMVFANYFREEAQRARSEALSASTFRRTWWRNWPRTPTVWCSGARHAR